MKKEQCKNCRHAKGNTCEVFDDTMPLNTSIKCSEFNPQPQEAWEIRLDKEFQGYLVLTDGKETLSKPREEIKQFIRTLLEAQQGELYAWFNKALLKQKQEIIEEFITGKRCLACGGLKENINASICGKCFNEE